MSHRQHCDERHTWRQACNRNLAPVPEITASSPQHPATRQPVHRLGVVHELEAPRLPVSNTRLYWAIALEALPLAVVALGVITWTVVILLVPTETGAWSLVLLTLPLTLLLFTTGSGWVVLRHFTLGATIFFARGLFVAFLGYMYVLLLFGGSSTAGAIAWLTAFGVSLVLSGASAAALIADERRTRQTARLTQAAGGRLDG